MLFSQIPYDTIQPYRHGVDTPLQSPPRSSTSSPVPPSSVSGAALDKRLASLELGAGTPQAATPHATIAPSPLRNVSGGARDEDL